MSRQRSGCLCVRAFVFVLVGLLGAPGCSGGTPDSACAEQAEADCAWQERCVRTALHHIYGDHATCVERTKLSCLAQFLPDSSAAPRDIEECAGAVQATSCYGGLWNNRACWPKPGARALGAACVSDWQCQSTFCRKSGDKSCGSCVARVEIGERCSNNTGCAYREPCDNAGCVFGTACGSTSLMEIETRCIEPGGEGAPCVFGRCQPGFVCEGGVCRTPMFMGTGEACDPMTSRCDGRQGEYCDATLRVCTAAKVLKSGEACSLLVDGGLASCGGSSRCQTGVPPMPRCVGPAKDGEACDPSKDISCMTPAVCHNGVCTPPGAGSCP